MTTLRPWQQWLKALLLASLFAAGAFAVTLLFPVCSGLGPRRGRSAREAIAKTWHRAVASALCLRVSHQGRPAPQGLLAANHLSWLDVVAIGMDCPALFVAKSEVAGWPVIGYLARRTGTLFLNRGDGHASSQLAETMAWSLRRGERLALFPEGTTSRGGMVLKFHARLLQPAITARATVQPVAIVYHGSASALVPFVDDDAFLPHLWRLLAQREIRADVRYGPMLHGIASRDELARRSREWIEGSMGLETCARARR